MLSVVPASGSSRLYFLLIVFLVYSNSQAQSKKDSVWIQTSDGCKVYNPHPVKNETITWTGKCVDGYARGEGTLTWFKSGNKNQEYTGHMERGNPHGYGKYDYTDGRTREGHYVRGDLTGIGRMIEKDKRNILLYYYEGEFKDDQRDGEGLEVYYYPSDGDTSSVYKGNFSHGDRNGAGLVKEYDYNRLSVYKGIFYENRLEGEAEIWKYRKGKQVLYYKGHLLDWDKDGYGEEIIGLNKYAGQWKKNKKEGNGKLFTDTVLIYDGEWKNDKFDGIGKRVFLDGSYYVGEFKKNERDGFGVLRWKDGIRYIGEFKKDLFTGDGYALKGKMICSSGSWDRGALVRTEDLRLVRKALEARYKDQFRQFLASQD